MSVGACSVLAGGPRKYDSDLLHKICAKRPLFTPFLCDENASERLGVCASGFTSCHSFSIRGFRATRWCIHSEMKGEHYWPVPSVAPGPAGSCGWMRSMIVIQNHSVDLILRCRRRSFWAGCCGSRESRPKLQSSVEILRNLSNGRVQPVGARAKFVVIAHSYDGLIVTCSDRPRSTSRMNQTTSNPKLVRTNDTNGHWKR